MAPTDLGDCDVCGRPGAVGVAAVPGAPVSLAYCRECLVHHAQPMFTIEVAVLPIGPDNPHPDDTLEEGVKRLWREAAIDPREHLAEWFLCESTFVDGQYVTIRDLLGRYLEGE